MSKYQGVFRRYEKKYLINQNQMDALMKRIENLMVPDSFGKSTICNIYFDTPSHKLIRNSIEGPMYKEKLRLRCYGVPGDDSDAFVELKKKYNGVVYKRRVNMKYSEAIDYVCSNNSPENPSQITNEIDWFKKFYENIIPSMVICYDRLAFYSIIDRNLRITFDTNIKWRTSELDLKKGVWGNTLLEQDQAIMEIKIPGSIPVWLAQELCALNIYPVSYSKYGTAYKTTIENIDYKIEGGNSCA